MATADQIFTVAQMQTAEQAIIDAGTSVRKLMQTAGEGAAEFIWRVTAGQSVTVLCGPGNNGGDGYVIAEVLRARGVDVTVIAHVPPMTDAARSASSDFQGQVVDVAAKSSGYCFVDCLFGSGLSRCLNDELLAIVRSLAQSHTKRVAVDLPSGFESNTGKLLNEGLPTYDLTIALGAWKYAHFLMPSGAKIGSKRLVPIGVDPVKNTAQRLIRPSLQAPPSNAHKYRRGMVGVVAGKMPGAASMAAQSAALSGAGYVKILGIPPAKLPDHIVSDLSPIEAVLKDHRFNAILIGPGLGSAAKSREIVCSAILADFPCVMDADALQFLDRELKTNQGIATPHEGELAIMERRFGLSGEGTKVERAQSLASASGMVIVAKGPDTIIADPQSDRVTIADNASSWLSTAGTGDVLAGVIASRLAVTNDLFRAACEGVWLHSEAARLAGPAFAANNLIEHIPAAVEQCL